MLFTLNILINICCHLLHAILQEALQLLSFELVYFQLAIGLMAGSLASCFNIPFDVAKSRIQGPQPQTASSAWTQEPIHEITYRQTVLTMSRIHKQEG